MAVIMLYKDSKKPDGKLKAIRTDCDTGVVREVEIGWAIRTDGKGAKWLYLIGGPSGYESASLEDLAKHPERGWNANGLTRTVSWPEHDEEGIHVPAGYSLGYDGLFVPPAEIERVLAGSMKANHHDLEPAT